MSLFDDAKNWLHEAFPFSTRQASGEKSPSETLLAMSRWAGEFTDRYFQVEVEGTENIPAEGGALLVSNHGFLAVESFVLHNVVLRNTGRALRPVAAHMAWDVPLFNHLVASAGAVRGDSETVVKLLEAGELVLIYPGGVREASKGIGARQKLMWDGRRGFVKAALTAQRPIIPLGISGADDVYLRTKIKLPGIGEMIGDRDANIPLFFGLGPFPFPASLSFRFGEPIPMSGGPEAAIDDNAVDSIHHKVRTAVEALLESEDPLSSEGS